MARVHSSRSVGTPLIYNIDHPVGPGCPNRPDDVALVQYLLKIAHDGRARLVDLNNWFEFVPPKPITPDGIFGPITADFIEVYYQCMRVGAQIPRSKPGPPVVHPARGLSIQQTGVLGIMVMLNIHFQRLRPADYLHIGVASDLPPKVAGSPVCLT